ncbi:hypothetical protein [Laspinema olomoucense]|uniref:hypothetical protein n=1 Tax=Laspinema olomoucense TaxID=3231600 RepID=UPI0021BAA98D|nr:hypothetical protein [Laspinema sp. D3c]MCT7996540.1 hypothetical protein [Laspinema sp. D3c]
MTKRRSLCDVVNPELTEPTPAAKSEPSPKKSKSKSDPKPVLHYLTLVRKETRLKEDPSDELSQLFRKLNRQRSSTPGKYSHAVRYRITEKT